MRRCPCWGIRLRCVYSGREHGRRRGGRERESRVEHRGRVGIIYLYAPKFLGYGVAPEVGRRLTRTQLCSRAPVSSAAIDSARSHHSDRIPPSNPATIRCAEMAHTHPRALRRQRLERNVSKHVACWADGICSEQIRKTQMHLAAAAARRAGAMAPSLLIAAAKGDTGAGRTGDQGVQTACQATAHRCLLAGTHKLLQMAWALEGSVDNPALCEPQTLDVKRTGRVLTTYPSHMKDKTLPYQGEYNRRWRHN